MRSTSAAEADATNAAAAKTVPNARTSMKQWEIRTVGHRSISLLEAASVRIP
jgi:hypothetical protein